MAFKSELDEINDNMDRINSNMDSTIKAYLLLFPIGIIISIILTILKLN